MKITYQEFLNAFLQWLDQHDIKNAEHYECSTIFMKNYNIYLDDIRRVTTQNHSDLPKCFEALLEFSKRDDIKYEIDDISKRIKFTSARAQAIGDVLNSLNDNIRRLYFDNGFVITEQLKLCLTKYESSPFNYTSKDSELEIEHNYRRNGKKYPIREKHPRCLYIGQIFTW